MSSQKKAGGATTAGDLRELELKLLKPSKINPRTIHFKERDAELDASVAANGIINPLLVRPAGKFFEIAAGHRRRDSAERAKLKTVPCYVREMDDETFEQLILIEGLQKDELHPLDEAAAYQRIIEARGFDIESLAVVVDKPQDYVLVRLSLTRLIEPLRKEFVSGRCDVDTAELLARVDPASQAEFAKKHKNDDDSWSFMQVRMWIQREVMTDLKNAPFKLDDAELLPAAGACFTCPKRSGATGGLFPDVNAKDQCFDSKCYRQKSDLAMKASIAQLEEQGHKVEKISWHYSPSKEGGALSNQDYTEIKKPLCEKAVKGIYVDGPKRGNVIDVCIRKNACSEHGSSSSTTRHVASPKERLDSRVKEIKTDRDRQVRLRTLDEIVGTVVKSGATLATLKTVVFCVFDRLWGDAKRSFFAHRKLTVAKPAGGYGRDFETPFKAFVNDMTKESEVLGVLVDVALHTRANGDAGWRQPKEGDLLQDVAKEQKVNVAKLEKEVDETVDAKLADVKASYARAKKKREAKAVKVKTKPKKKGHSEKLEGTKKRAAKGAK